jgi:DNA-binding Lrp family transcriptional regulator
MSAVPIETERSVPNFQVCEKVGAILPWVERLDRQIVHCLHYDGRLSFRRIAEVLDVSEQTVGRRLRAMQAAGAVRVQALPDARVTGQRTWFVRMQCRPDAALALADAMAGRDDVSWVSVTSGGSEIVCVARSDPDLARGSVLHRLPRTSQVLSFTAFTVLHIYSGSTRWLALDDPLTEEQVAALRTERKPAGRAQRGGLRDDDAPLVAELGRDGRAGVVALARATGWPQSRVSARLDELLATGTLDVKVDLAPGQFGYRCIAYLWLTVTPGEIAETGAALARHPVTTFVAAVTGAANLLVTVICRTDADLYAYVTTTIGGLPAIRQVEIVPVLHRLKQGNTRVRDERLASAT